MVFFPLTLLFSLLPHRTLSQWRSISYTLGSLFIAHATILLGKKTFQTAAPSGAQMGSRALHYTLGFGTYKETTSWLNWAKSKVKAEVRNKSSDTGN